MADAEVDARLRVVRVHAVHVVALLVRHHLERQLVVVAQEDGPLRGLGDRRRLGQDVDDREAILLADRHEHARHHREVEGHVALVAVAEVVDGVFRPLVRLGQDHAVVEPRIDVRAQVAQHAVRLGKVLAVRPLALVQVGHGVEPEPVHAHLEPVVDDPEERLLHLGVLEVEIGLVRVEAVPEVGARDRVPRPVRGLEVLEDDARVRVAVGRVAPDVEVARLRAGSRATGALEPGVLIRGVVQHELRDHAQAAVVGGAQERAEVAQRPVGRVHGAVVRRVVPVVSQRRGIERQQPDRGDAEVGDVVEARQQAAEVADAVAVRVLEGADVHLVDERVLVPVGLAAERVDRSAHLHLGVAGGRDHWK